MTTRDYTRLVPAPESIRSLRDMVREHLNDARITQAQLAQIWGMHEVSARRLLNPHRDRQNQIKPHMIDALVRALKLDDFDAHALHFRGAVEAGFKLKPHLHLRKDHL